MTAPISDHEPTGSTSAADATMRAVVQRAYGTADLLHLDRIARPTIGDDEVLVEVRAAGLDRGTWHLMTGVPYAARLAFGIRRPKQPVPGIDVAGVVRAVGSAVTRFAPGDEVYGVGSGTFAEFAVAKEKKLARKPANLDFHQAAAVPVSGLTAQQGLLDAGGLRPGQRVLITGASGGVGTFAVQIAAAHGAEVTGVCSTSKLDLVRSLGAQRVIDYTTTDFTAEGRRYDLVLDIGGSPSLAQLRRATTERGTVVLVGAEGGGKLLGVGRQLRAVVLSPFVSQSLKMLVAKDHHEPLERLTALIETGRVMPVIHRAYPLEEAATAMRDLEAGRIRGKAVVVP